MATHSSVLAWRIPETVEPGGLPSMGWHRVGQADKTWQLGSNIYRAPNICQISCRALNVLSHLVLKTTLIWLVPQNVLQTGRLRFREANPWIHSQFFFFFAFYTLIIIGYFKSNLWVLYIYIYIKQIGSSYVDIKLFYDLEEVKEQHYVNCDTIYVKKIILKMVYYKMKVIMH